MKLPTNIMCFQQKFGLEKTLQIFADAGFEAIEFNSDIEEYYTDSHTLPYYGTIDWENVMRAFAEIGYEGNLNYEAGLFVKNVPDCLRKESAIYMAKVVKYLIERFLYYKNNQGTL